MKKILVTGANGQLGYDVVKELNKRGYEAIGFDRDDMDITDNESVNICIKEVNPYAIIHCAAYTTVDRAEDNKEICRNVNFYGTKYIADICKELDILIIYISTDYVFDGMKDTEYTEDDIVNPLSVYGETKYEGEAYIRDILDKYYIVRISWVFGKNGNNFIDTMIRLSRDIDKLSIINDQVGSPTYTKDLSRLLVDMVDCDKYGTYHATNGGDCSWYEFAKYIFDVKGIDIDVKPINTDEYQTKATRPKNSKMSKQKLIENGFNTLRNWKEAVSDYLDCN